jgi:hypothetical protein
VHLQRERLVEGQSRAIGQCKVWRLTKKARDLLGVKRRPVPFTVQMEHWLALADVYVTLKLAGGLRYFVPELREKIPGTDRMYCGDAYVHFRDMQLLLEVQRTSKSKEDWREKWERLIEWDRKGGVKQASFQRFYPEPIRPSVVVVTSQTYDVVSGGLIVPVTIVRDISELT